MTVVRYGVNILKAYASLESAAKAAVAFQSLNGGAYNVKNSCVEFPNQCFRVYFLAFEDKHAVMRIAGANFSFVDFMEGIDQESYDYIRSKVRRPDVLLAQRK